MILLLVLWRYWFGRRKSIRPLKNWAMRCWHYLSGVSCKWFTYGPADATVSCLIETQNGLLFFWCQLTQVVPERRPLGHLYFVHCTVVCYFAVGGCFIVVYVILPFVFFVPDVQDLPGVPEHEPGARSVPVSQSRQLLDRWHHRSWCVDDCRNADSRCLAILQFGSLWPLYRLTLMTWCFVALWFLNVHSDFSPSVGASFKTLFTAI